MPTHRPREEQKPQHHGRLHGVRNFILRSEQRLSRPEKVGGKFKETRHLKGSKIFRKCRIDAAEEQVGFVRLGSEDFEVAQKRYESRR